MDYFSKFLNKDNEFLEEQIENIENSPVVEAGEKTRELRREPIPGFLKSKGFFFVGEFLEILLFYRNMPFIFEGLCLSIRKKNFRTINTSIFLRNIVIGVGIELVFSFFFSRSYSFKILEYKRRIKNYRRAKILWFRVKLRRDHVEILS